MRHSLAVKMSNFS